MIPDEEKPVDKEAATKALKDKLLAWAGAHNARRAAARIETGGKIP